MIDSFRNDYAFLSNFAYSPVEYDGVVYPTVEHAFQAAKTLDKNARLSFMGLTAEQAKQLGRKIALRPDWEQVKLEIMEILIERKFADPFLQDKLVKTHPHELIEGNNWNDTFWGVCKGVGQNNLGKILMKVRERCLS